MALTQDMVLEKLKNVIDPELFVNIVDLGLIYEIQFHSADAAPQVEPAAPDTNAGESDAVDSETRDREVTATSDPDTQDSADAPAAADAESSDCSTNVPGTGDTKVHIDMTMTSPACPAGPQLIGGAKKEVMSIDGVTEVEVRIVLDPPWTPDRMTEDAKDTLGIF